MTTRKPPILSHVPPLQGDQAMQANKRRELREALLNVAHSITREVEANTAAREELISQITDKAMLRTLREKR